MSFANMKVSRKLAVAFASILVAVTAMAGIVGKNISDIETAAGWDQHTTTVLAQAHLARQGIVEQVAGVRGYIISQNDSFLAAFQTGLSTFNDAVAQIGTLTDDNPAQQERVARLKAAGADYKAKVADTQLSLASDPATLVQAADLTRNGGAAPYIAAVKGIIAEISDAEQKLLVIRRADSEDSFAWAYGALGIGAALAFAIAVSMGWLLSRGVARPIVEMTEAMKRLAAGDRTIAIPAAGRGDELGDMAAALDSFKKAAIEKERLETMTAGERQAAEQARREAERQAATAAKEAFVAAVRPSFEKLSAGDLTTRLDPRVNADYVEVCELFNTSVSKLEATIGSVATAVGSMRTGLGEITVAAGDLSQRTEQQAASLEQTVAALSEVMRGVNGTAESASKAQKAAAAAQKNAEKGGEIVGQAIAAMGEIERSSDQIGKIIGVIDEIAFQTNLLALNAGVEAARAGEAGRGFAVVAQEVRGLAQRSAEAAKEIKNLISTSSTQVEQGVDLVTASGRSLEDIVSGVAQMTSVVAEIARAAREQATSLREVSTAADQMDKVTQQNAAMVEETTAAAQTLSSETEHLAEIMQGFRTMSSAASPAPVARRTANRPSAPRAVAQMRTLGTGGAAPRSAPAAAADDWAEF